MMCLGSRFFCMLLPYWDSVPNHNRQTAASNASVNTHSPFLLVGYYAPNPTERRIHSAAARSANAFEVYAKMPTPLQGCNESLHPDYLKGYRETAWPSGR